MATPLHDEAVRSATLANVIDERVQVYGEPREGFARIAQVWSGILGIEVRADQVALCQIGMKLVRTSVTPEYSDNSDDVEGYLDIFRKVIGEDMIHARSVDDFIAQRKEREA